MDGDRHAVANIAVHRTGGDLQFAIAAVDGLLFGYDTGVVSGARLFLQNSFSDISSLRKELATGLLPVGAAVGAAGRPRDH